MTEFTLSIESDEFQWKICKTTTTEKGNISTNILGYYPSVELLESAVVEKGLKLYGIDNLVQAKQEILKLIKEIRK